MMTKATVAIVFSDKKDIKMDLPELEMLPRQSS
jgi:hypothetical protein